MSLVFALRPLVAIRRVSPLQALRRDADAIVLRLNRLDPLRVGVSLGIVASVVLLALSRAGNVRRGIGFSVAIILAVGALFGSAVLLSWLARHLVRPRWPFVLRQGIASLYRPGNQTRAVVLSLGFGVFLMSTLYQVHHSLLKTLDVKLTQARANLVFFDVQQDQDRGVDSIVHANGFAIVQQVPLVAMRAVAPVLTTSEPPPTTARATIVPADTASVALDARLIISDRERNRGFIYQDNIATKAVNRATSLCSS